MNNPISGIGGSLTALATPFREKQVDWKALSLLSERQIDRGTAALVVCGSTGEAASLILPEYARTVRTVVEAAAGRVPVIAGCPGHRRGHRHGRRGGSGGRRCAPVRRAALCEAYAGRASSPISGRSPTRPIFRSYSTTCHRTPVWRSPTTRWQG
jgi:hypothetical protein